MMTWIRWRNVNGCCL